MTLFNNNENNIYSLKERKNKAMHNNYERKNDLAVDYNDEKNKINKNDPTKKYKSKILNKTPNKESRYKKLKENYSTKANNTLNSKYHIIYKIKTINIKKRKRKNKSYS